MDNNIDKVFSEERKIKIVTDDLKTKGIKKEWFKIEETTSLDYTYSSIKLTDNDENYIYKNGYICLLIGINPKGNDDYKQEIEEFKEEKKKNPNLRHRKSCGDSIERTRNMAIRNALKQSDNTGIKELVTIDLFSQRTNNSHDLIRFINDNPDKINDIIGNKNKVIMKEYIEKAGIIIVAWGSVDNLWDSAELSDYKDIIYEWLNKDRSKVWWFGANADGSPKHARFGCENNFCTITEDELKRVFRKK